MKRVLSIVIISAVLPLLRSSNVTHDEVHLRKKRESDKKISFQGCFGGSPSFITSYHRNDNINHNCVNYCKDKGFIIAATKGTFCGCTNTLPDKQIARADSNKASGPNSFCNTRCPGVWSTGSCRGDECCGGSKAYSVFVVGQIDVMKQVLRRVAENLRYNNGKALKRDFGEMPYRYIQHFGGKCFNSESGSSNPGNNERLNLGSVCDHPRNWFRMLSDGSIQHIATGKCLHPFGGSPILSDGTEVVFHNGCHEKRLQFELTPHGSIKHKTSGKCLHPKDGSLDPSSGTRLVFHTGCDEKKLVFTLKPTAKSDFKNIKQYTSGKCLHPRGGSPSPGDNTDVVIHNGCNEPRLWLEMLHDGSIRHVTSGKCFHPYGGSAYPADNTAVVLHSGCGEGRLQFRVLRNGCIQHKTSRKCLHPYGGSAHPGDNTKLVFHNGCGNEPRLYFNFVRSYLPALPDFVVRTIGETINTDGQRQRKECILRSSLARAEKSFACKDVTEKGSLVMEFGSMTRELEHGFGQNLTPLGQYDSELDNIYSPHANDLTKEYSVTDTVADSFSTEAGLSLSTTFGISQSLELGIGVKSTTTVSSEMTVGGFFSAGYKHDVSSSITEKFSVSIKVPPYSKGLVNLFQETYPLEIKWRATMFAKGTLYVSCAGITKRYHVSEVLNYSQRQLYSFGTIKFGDRQKIVAIVKIVDKNGNVIEKVSPKVSPK